MKTYLLNLLFFAFAFSFGLSTVTVYDFASRFLRPATKAVEIQPVQLVAPSHTLAVTEAPPVIETIQDISEPAEAEEFHADGDYYPEGKLPREFKDIEFVSIVTRKYKLDRDGNDYSEATLPRGHLLTDKEFHFKRVLINGRVVSFETETKNGISYRFEGSIKEFYPEKNSEYSTDNLSGLLIKRKHGKSVAETQITLEYYVGC